MFSTPLLHQRTRFTALAVLLAGMATLVSPPTPARAGAKARCKPVGGLLLDEHIEGDVAVARMVGGITGRYTYTLRDSFPADTVRTNLVYITGTSVVAAKGGTLSFFETSTQDTAEPGNLNGTVLMTITGGTGKWTGAVGHIVLVGAFHQDTLTGAWSYVGKVCVP